MNANLSSFNGDGSRRLVNLAQQLCPPNAPVTSNEDVHAGKIASPVGFARTSAPTVNQEKKFKTKNAAVLVCLFKDEHGALRVILTRRSSKISTHSGEVSLPGGKAEEGDASDAETVLREAKEEIGLDPSIVNIVTILEPFLSKHGLRVVPVIGMLSDKTRFKPVPSTNEVEAVFDAPLEMFLKDENHRSEERQWMQEKFLMHYFDYEKEGNKFVIWGLTAGIQGRLEDFGGPVLKYNLGPLYFKNYTNLGPSYHKSS